MMLVVVAYDVSTESDEGKRRLRHVAKVCEDFGQRVQNSVFECLVDAAQWTGLRARLVGEIKSAEDSLRFYFLGDNWQRRVEHVGAKLKRTGMHWTTAGANAIIAQRCAKLSGRSEDFWERREAQLAPAA